MAKPATAEQRSAEDPASRVRQKLAAPIVLLLFVALASNVYLAQLYVRVQQASAGSVESFCNVNETINCANVAASGYSSFLGLPVAVYGAEFYGLSLLCVLLCLTRLWRLRHWDSLIFWLMLLALPVSLTMAYISAFVIKMLCPLCSAVYGANVLVLVLLLVARRGALGHLLRAGPCELRQALSSLPLRAGLAVLAVAAISQFFWVPPLLGQPHRRPIRRSARGTQHAYPPGGRLVGTPGAPVEIKEFSDFQCSVCSHAHEVVVELLRENSGKVYFQHLDFPLDMSCNREVTRPFHSHACKASYFARCADEQGRFWPFVDLLFHNQEDLSEPNLEAYAQQVGLDVDKLTTCARRPETRQAILGEVEEGIRLGVQGTPTFFVNGEKIVGPRDIAFWRRKIAELSKQP